MATKRKKKSEKQQTGVKPKPKGELPPREAARTETHGTESGRESRRRPTADDRGR